MIKHTATLLAMALVAWAPVASADEAPVRYSGNRDSAVLCDAETTVNTPCVVTADDTVWNVSRYESIVIDLSLSVGAFTCMTYGNNVGHDATTPDGVGQALHATNLTQSAYTVTLTRPPTHVWIECSSITTSVTAIGRGRAN